MLTKLKSVEEKVLIRIMSFEELQIVAVKAGDRFTPTTGNGLYIAVGKSFDGVNRAAYVGITKNSIEQRHREHGSISCDRPYGFHVDYYVVFEMPSHWVNEATYGEVSTAEDLLMYTLAHNLNGTGYRLDNRRINTKVRYPESRNPHEVVDFLREKVYPYVNDNLIPLSYHEPVPEFESKGARRNGYWQREISEYVYENGSRGNGIRERNIKKIYTQNSSWIYNRATKNDEIKLKEARKDFYDTRKKGKTSKDLFGEEWQVSRAKVFSKTKE